MFYTWKVGGFLYAEPLIIILLPHFFGCKSALSVKSNRGPISQPANIHQELVKVVHVLVIDGLKFVVYREAK